MIFGDPFRFAVLIQFIPEWSNDRFKNGLFHFFVDGEIFPSQAKAATLWVDVLSLSSESNSLISHQEDQSLYEMNADDAFRTMLEITYPNSTELNESMDLPQPERFLASTENINDSGFAVFAVSFEDKVRVLGAKHSELVQSEGRAIWMNISNCEVKEAILSKKDICGIVSRTTKYYESL